MALALGELAEAEAGLLPAIEGLASLLPADHRALLSLREAALRLRIAQGRQEEARGLLATLWPLVQGKFGPASAGAGLFASGVGDAWLAAGAGSDAVVWLRRALELLLQTQPAEATTVECAMALATAIVQTRGEPALAREGLTRASEQVRQRLGAEHRLVAELAAHGVKLGLVPS